MATLTASNLAESGGTVASFPVTLTGGGAGELVVIYSKHETSASTATCSDGTTSLTADTIQDNGAASSWGQFFYLLSSAAGTKTYTVTYNNGSKSFPTVIGWQFAGSAAGTWSFDARNSASGLSVSPSSGNYIASSLEGVGLGGYAEDSGVTTTTERINAIAATGVQRAVGNFTSSWYRLLSAGFTGPSSATLSTGQNWACNGIAFKRVAAVAAAPSTLYYPRKLFYII